MKGVDPKFRRNARCVTQSVSARLTCASYAAQGTQKVGLAVTTTDDANICAGVVGEEEGVGGGEGVLILASRGLGRSARQSHSFRDLQALMIEAARWVCVSVLANRCGGDARPSMLFEFGRWSGLARLLIERPD